MSCSIYQCFLMTTTALADRQVQPRYYLYNELKRATRDFHMENKLGHGAFGAVYKVHIFPQWFYTTCRVKIFNLFSFPLLSFMELYNYGCGRSYRHIKKIHDPGLGWQWGEFEGQNMKIQ